MRPRLQQEGPDSVSGPPLISAKYRDLQNFSKWAMLGSNQRPPPCKGEKGRCRALRGVANPAYLRAFLFSALPRVAPYCVPGGVKVVSGVRGSRVADSLAN